MKKNFSTLIVAAVALSMSFYSASASLIGAPLNLKVAIELNNADVPAPVCQFHTDDVLMGPLLVSDCLRA